MPSLTIFNISARMSETNPKLTAIHPKWLRKTSASASLAEALKNIQASALESSTDGLFN